LSFTGRRLGILLPTTRPTESDPAKTISQPRAQCRPKAALTNASTLKAANVGRIGTGCANKAAGFPLNPRRGKLAFLC